MANSMLEDSVQPVLQERSVLQELLLAPIVPRIKFQLLAPVPAQLVLTDKVHHR